MGEAHGGLLGSRPKVGPAPAALVGVGGGGAKAAFTSTSVRAFPSLPLLPRHLEEGKGRCPCWEGVP